MFTDTHANQLGWMLDAELGSLDGVRCAVLISSDGLLSSRASSLGQDAAEELAAIGSTLRGAARSFSGRCDSGQVRQVLVEMDHDLFLITEAGQNMLLLTQTGPDADVATITQAMAQLAGRVGHEMSAAARRPAREANQG